MKTSEKHIVQNDVTIKIISSYHPLEKAIYSKKKKKLKNGRGQSINSTTCSLTLIRTPSACIFGGKCVARGFLHLGCTVYINNTKSTKSRAISIT